MQTASGPILWAIEACWFCMYEGWRVSLSRVSREWAVILGKKTMWIYVSMARLYWSHHMASQRSPESRGFNLQWTLDFGMSIQQTGAAESKRNTDNKFHRINGLGQNNTHLLQCSWVQEGISCLLKFNLLSARSGSDLWLLVCVRWIAPLVRARWIFHVRSFCI